MVKTPGQEKAGWLDTLVLWAFSLLLDGAVWLIRRLRGSRA
jgi:hypothetical protein